MWRAASLALCLLTSTALAEPVALVSIDGYTSFEGDLLKVDNNFYVLDTSVGVVRIPVSEVKCVGLGCPDRAASPGKQLTQDQKDELFNQFLEWRKTNAGSEDPNDELFRRFLEWRKKANAN